MKKFLKALRTAFCTLTIIPLPGKDTDNFGDSLPWFSIVGLGIAGVFYASFLLFQYMFSGTVWISSFLLLLLSFIITGGLHADGFADSADGFGGGRNKDQILLIFKDSRIGTFGSAALWFDLTFKLLLYYYLFTLNFFLPIGLSIILSRAYQAGIISHIPNARGSSSIASAFAAKSSKITYYIVFIGLVAMLLFIFDYRIVAFVLLSTFIAVSLFIYYALRKIKGITGDCIGAANEICEIVSLISGLMAYHFVNQSL